MRRITTIGAFIVVLLISGSAHASTRVMTPSKALNELLSLAPDEARNAYSNGFGTINMEDGFVPEDPLRGTKVYGFSKVGTFMQSSIPRGSWVMYDLEWKADESETSWQLRKPRAAIKRFLQTAHSRGLKVVIAVGLGVVEKVKAADCQRRKFELLADAFLRCGIVAIANAYHADMLMTLTQRYVCDPATFRTATQKLANAFHGPVFAELSVLPSRDCLSAARIYRNYRYLADSGSVEGLALWTSGQPGLRPYEEQLTMAAKVLEMIAAGDAQGGGGSAKCLGLRPTTVGTKGADTFVGTPGNDVIVGMGGNDTFRPSGGSDKLCGGAGADTIEGGAGDDKLSGGLGGDKLMGGFGSDSLVGGPGGDECDGGPGTDSVSGCQAAGGGGGNQLLESAL